MEVAKQRSRWALALERHLRAKFLAGILLVVPIAVTVFVLKLVFDFLDDVLVDIARSITGRDVNVPAGVGIALTIALTYLVGLLAANIIGRQLLGLLNVAFERVPIVKTVYTAVRQIVEAFSGTGKVKFKRVVILDWPRPGVKSLGFITGQVIYRGNQRMVSVYLPTTPNPTNGFLAIVPEQDVMETNMSVEEGIKMIISGGIVSPDAIQTFQVTSPAQATEGVVTKKS
jgi:uncharacterized membrane protein